MPLDIILLLLIAAASLALGNLLPPFFSFNPVEQVTFELSDGAIARIVHEAYRAYCASLGDLRHRSWNNLEQPQRDVVINAVRFLRVNPHLKPAVGTHLKSHLMVAIVRLFEARA